MSFVVGTQNFGEPHRFVGEYGNTRLFCNIMFPKSVRDDSDRSEVGWTILNVPSFIAEPERDGTLSNRAVIMDIVNRVALVIGPADYCGVNKKTMFTGYELCSPAKGQLSMHCSANVGPSNDSAILGLSEQEKRLCLQTPSDF